MKKWIVISCGLMLGIGVIVACLFCIKNDESNNGDVIMKLSIYPSSGGFSNTYYFEITNDKMLKCYFGDRRNNNIKSPKYIKNIISTDEKRLTENEKLNIFNHIKKLQENDYKKSQYRVNDSWSAMLLYENEIYEMVDYWDDENEFELLKNLIDAIVELSPIPVDLHGWA